MALVIRKDFVYARSRSYLRRNHLPGLITDLFLVRWVLQLAIPSVAATSFCTWAAINARAKILAFGSFEIGFDVAIKRSILLDVLKKNLIFADLRSNTCLWSRFNRALCRPRCLPKWYPGQAAWYKCWKVIGECPSSERAGSWHYNCQEHYASSNTGCLIGSLDQMAFRKNLNTTIVCWLFEISLSPDDSGS